METKVLTNWTARRAGAHITIAGTDTRTGRVLKLTGIEQIEAGKDGGRPTATDKHGVCVELA